ncbi:50S ribosomal protein L24e [Candidatus Bathyarchaeota archaeon]|nr:50S ribosomal protein L24e [Candidatus Bathyarchaeota archaeon]
MPRSYDCSFCNREIPVGSGIMYIRNDGTVLRFCSSKCRKALLERSVDARKLKWTKS